MKKEDPLHAIEDVLKERYVHGLSSLLYERIATLWHLDPEIERELASLCGKLWWGYFCICYLSHFHRDLKERHGVDKGLRAEELTEGVRRDLKRKFSDREMVRRLKEEILPQLKEMMEKVEPKDMDSLTAMIHSGEYLLSSLEDMAEDRHEEYHLWLPSIPHLYRKDLHYLGVMRLGPRRPSMPIYNYISNMKELMPKGKGVEIQSVRRSLSPRRLPKARKGFYPCKTRVYTLTV